MCGGAEAVEADSLSASSHRVRPVADQPRAEKRRRLEVRVARRHGEAVALVCDRLLREPAVDVVPGEACVVAEVLAPAEAIAAAAARPGEPGDADTLPDCESGHAFADGVHRADDLMPEDERQLRPRQLAVDDVKIGTADAAGQDVEPNGARAGLRTHEIALDERLTHSCEDHRSHARLRPHAAR